MISSRVQYATRGMRQLALHHGGPPLALHEIAAREQIPEKYLETIFSTLRRRHLVESVKGKRGGYRLSDSPEKVTLLSIVQVYEPGLLTGGMNSSSPDFAIWSDVESVLRTKLAGITVADLADAYRRKQEAFNYAI
ncbi:MAG TPA: Rrf2 family transcriptional regulator [Spirochaetia bacterium]|nr:Rrf2 family transcriptional regulator [Spirochaetia bacterium]